MLKVWMEFTTYIIGQNWRKLVDTYQTFQLDQIKYEKHDDRDD
jgi:hypothetical protein